MRIAITGSTGLIGEAAVAAASQAGHEVVRVVRGPASDDHPSISWEPARGEIDSPAFADIDSVIHLAGEPIGARRWSSAQKARIRDSRTSGTGLVAGAMAAPDRPRVLVSASAIGYYGDRGDEVLTEDSPAGSGFVAGVCRDWEAATASAEAAGVRVIHARNGLVLSPKGGSLAEQLPFFRLGLGGRFGTGEHWWSWISLTDTVAALLWLLEADAVAGPVNITAPNPVTNAEFTSTLARVLRRPTLPRTPKLGVVARLGRELTEELVYTSARVEPRVLLDGGFAFTHTELEPALRDLLGRP